ncbi:MAG: hypothetical protein KF749_10245 [Bacteroidetes bacterium]|nr:hypothetical protein [Bacteroidota bacterium]MCW5896657.1 hypothetical protein [Bacteroidota bacterium]
MKTTLFTVLSFLIITTVFTDSSFSARKKHVILKPKQVDRELTIVLAGKNRTYYPLSAAQPSKLEVKGPGTLRILTRARFEGESSDDVRYGIHYRIGGSARQTFEVDDVEQAPDARYKGDATGTPGEAEEFILNINKGVHTVEFTLQYPTPKVAARYLFTPHKQKRTKWVALSPLAPVEPVDLYEAETAFHYFRFSKQKPLRLEIIGPTELRIRTRVENSFTMKGRVNYRLQIRQGDQVVQSYQLSSKRSETAMYKDNTKLVPGKPREIVFTVPAGKQYYEITPLDHHTLLGQILFPQKDAKLEM